MNIYRVDLNFLDRDDHAPVGYKDITCHLILYIKTDLTRKARYVSGGNLTDPPLSTTYASVVSRDSVRLDFLITALNDLYILAGDIQNTHLNAPTKEKSFYYAGDEWESDQGKVVIIFRALYGLKYIDLEWRNHLSEILGNQLIFQLSLADPNIWFKVVTYNISNKQYTYILVHVDDLLIFDKDLRKYISMLESKYTVKPYSIGEPKVYLGTDSGKVLYGDGSYAWTMSSNLYVK